jgi:hypothetical protein
MNKKARTALQISLVMLAIMFVGFGVSEAIAGTNITANGFNTQPALFNMTEKMKDMVNELKNVQLYHSNGPVLKVVLASGAEVKSVEAAGAVATVAITSTEVIVNGVKKIIAAQATDTFTGATIETHYQAKTLVYYDHATTSIIYLQGTAVDATSETAILPALPALMVPIGSILIKTTSADFVPGTTNFNASNVTTTVEDLFYVNSGTSALATDISFTNQ